MEKVTNGLIQPEEILSQLNLHDDIMVADFGCGNGYFSVPLAKIVNRGQIYALDVVSEALEAVKSRADMEGLENIKLIHCDLEIWGGSKLEENSIDLVLMRNILFQSKKKGEIIKEAKRVLKPKGKLVLLEWVPGASLAPKEGWLVSKDEAKELVEIENFTFNRELTLDNQHYGLVFDK